MPAVASLNGVLQRHARLLLVLAATAITFGRAVWLPWSMFDSDATADPFAAHVVNLLLHLGVTSTLYVLMVRLGATREVASGATALFALHPLVTNSLCVLSGRVAMIATGMLLGAMALAASVGKQALGRRAALSALAVLSTGILLASLADGGTGVIPGLRAGFDTTSVAIPRLVDFAWPRGMLVEHHPAPGDTVPTTILVLLTAVAMAVTYARRRTSPGSSERFAFVVFAASLAPALLQPATAQAPSFYLPLAFAALLLATVGARHWRGLFGAEWVAVTLAVLSVMQLGVWSSPVAMFAPVAARYPDDPRAIGRLAFAYGEERKHAMAVRTFADLETRFPDFRFDRGRQSSSFARMGDRRRADGIVLDCVRERDVDCAMAYWKDIVAGDRQPGDSSSELVGSSYELASESLKQSSTAPALRRIASKLREKGLELLARRAEADAHAKEQDAS